MKTKFWLVTVWLLSTLAAGQSAEPVESIDIVDTTRSTSERLDDLRTFTDVIRVIREHYVESVDDRALLGAAIKGMLSTLDPHSAWIPAERFQSVTQDAAGEYGGLGMDVQIIDNFLVIVDVVPNAPADRAKLKAKDKIISINDESLRGRNLREALATLRGQPGTQIKLGILHADKQEGEEQVELVRELISNPSVRGQLLLDHYAHLRVESFQQGTDLQFQENFYRLSNLADENLRGVILDMRGNPGGVVESAVAMVDLFVDEGLIVSADGRDERTDFDFMATQGTMTDLPVIVLIDAGSASAAEIVAGALQDHSRAVIMGQTSFGKGSVQTVLPLRNGSGLRLTTSQYFTPSGRSIQATGIIPDVVIARVSVLESPQFSREADLAGRLQNPQQNTSLLSAAEQSMMAVQQRVSMLTQSDYTLAQAVNFLRGLNVLKNE